MHAVRPTRHVISLLGLNLPNHVKAHRRQLRGFSLSLDFEGGTKLNMPADYLYHFRLDTDSFFEGIADLLCHAVNTARWRR